MSPSPIRPSRWLPYSKPNANDAGLALRLFCLPHAGGSAMSYHPWHRLLAASVDLCAIELPGHGSRLDERPFTRMAPLLEALSEALEPWLSVPFAFFGHSLGASIAYEAALRLRRPASPVHLAPLRLFVSGRAAPDPASEPRGLHRLGDAELIAAFARLGGTPAAVLAREDLMAALLPGIRADLELIDTYMPSMQTLECPITAMGGAADRMVDHRCLAAWSNFTSAEFRLRTYPGGHFYLADGAAAVVTDLLRDLEPG